MRFLQCAPLTYNKKTNILIIMKTVFLCGLAVFWAVHLWSILARKEIVQSISKVCLLPLVFAVYITGVSGTGQMLIPVILALFFGWIGDIFLIKIENLTFFRLGLASFLLGHILYIVAMLKCTDSINSTALIISVPVGIALGFFIFKLIRPSKEMIVPAIAYETVILIMVMSAIQLAIARGSPYGTLVLAGGICFLVSDAILAFITFRGKPWYGDFPVMLTYISAQLCIILGMSGLSITGLSILN